MQNDKVTLKDLSVFTSDHEGSIFSLLDHTTTLKGREFLKRHIVHPPKNYAYLLALQDVVKYWAQQLEQWPSLISNGTLVMLEQFFESADSATLPPSPVNLLFGAFFQKLFNKNEYSFTQFSLSHLSDFLKGCSQLASINKSDNVPALLSQELEMIAKKLEPALVSEIMAVNKATPFRELAKLAFRARREMKNHVADLVNAYAKLDAWKAMAKATSENNWIFPVLLSPDSLCYEAEGLYHPLLKQPVPYNISFENDKNFMLLTGANMSGKTTFMRAMGVAALLAHMGMGVPAGELKISFMTGIISDMQVEDNLLLGESYFFAEVQRMKLTAQKLAQKGSYLVLMDELFKGTNVHDAYECTRAVIEGLLNKTNHIMVLSTHLHEVAKHFSNNSGIIFNYFVTDMANESSYRFTYELRNGISDDRIGYRILKQEGVIDLLKYGY